MIKVKVCFFVWTEKSVKKPEIEKEAKEKEVKEDCYLWNLFQCCHGYRKIGKFRYDYIIHVRLFLDEIISISHL